MSSSSNDSRSNSSSSNRPGNRQKKRPEIICRCNNVTKETIEKSIIEGADTMNKIFDATTAGVGPCGGSCRRKIVPMLENYLKEKKLNGKE